MKKLILLLTLILLATLVHAETWQYTTGEIDINLKINSQITIIPEQDDWLVEELTTKLKFFPKQTEYQKINYLTTTPLAIQQDNLLIYEWNNPTQTDLEFSLDTYLTTSQAKTEIKEKIHFPIINLPQNLTKYTQSQENIILNSEIIQLASEITKGEDDLFIAVFQIAQWVKNNINYSLDEYTETLSQPSTWVLENKYGACDEITTLFIALTRALNIPSRYVSGYAYTNWNDLNDFRSHAWAEVYFPNYGWTQFDVTYGEMGFIDATHITLANSLDSNQEAVSFEMMAYKANLESHELNIQPTIIEKKQTLPNEITINLDIEEQEIDFGSYNLLKAEIQNLKPYYIIEELSLSNNQKIELFQPNKKYVLLEPNQKKTIFWKFKISEDLNSGYYYTFPISIYTNKNQTESTEFIAKENEQYLTSQDIDELLEEQNQEQQKTYSKKINLECSSKEFSYLEEPLEISCKISNQGNVYLENLEICSEDCKTLNLGIGETKTTNFTSTTKQRMKVRAQNSEVSKTFYLTTEILDYPELEIIDLNAPKLVNYQDNFSISFGIKKTSKSNPIQLEVSLDNRIKDIQINELNQQQNLKLNLKGKDLGQGNNTLTLTITHQDRNQKKYITTKQIIVELEKVTFIQKIKIFINKINRALNNI